MIIKTIAYILNLFAPITNILGLLGFFYIICVKEDFDMLGILGAFAFIGLIFGYRAYKLDIPPRWRWSKSSNQLFNFTISTILGYAIMFAAWPSAIYFVKYFSEGVIDK